MLPRLDWRSFSHWGKSEGSQIRITFTVVNILAGPCDIVSQDLVNREILGCLLFAYWPQGIASCNVNPQAGADDGGLGRGDTSAKVKLRLA